MKNRLSVMGTYVVWMTSIMESYAYKRDKSSLKFFI